MLIRPTPARIPDIAAGAAGVNNVAKPVTMEATPIQTVFILYQGFFDLVPLIYFLFFLGRGGRRS